MIRTPSRPVRVGVALVGVAGALSLAGCGATTAADTGSAQTDAGTTDALLFNWEEKTFSRAESILAYDQSSRISMYNATIVSATINSIAVT